MQTLFRWTRCDGPARLGAIAYAAVVLGITATSQAGTIPIPVSNPSFESPALTDGNFTDGSGAIPGWTTSNLHAGVYNPTSADYSNAGGQGTPNGGDGSQVGFIVIEDPPHPAIVSVSQTLSTALADSTEYSLTIALGTRLDRSSAGYTVELLAGSNVIASETNAITLLNGQLTDRTITYTSLANDPNAGQPLGILITNTISTFIATTDFDNVRLTATAVPDVPEPAGVTLALCGLAGVLACRLRRRQR